ncbi:MAG: histidine--tRNA ligase [Acetomicrobium sp.]|jgi:histidyl-tRNA synthetase|nr:histidine--tRNA ligase [Acetomicrobium sp.]MDI9377064.1 histidine--tRNA ligase [Synergistota bacterium]HOB11135.1 histidine--tRNA ligase [Acetomicrobium sp.]
MDIIKAPRGVRDVLPDESWKWAYVVETARKVADAFGYDEVHLPIFEHTELFSRGIGDSTDVVEKEMYTFKDRSGRSLTLRPELTASMVRCYLEHGMSKRVQPVKLWSVGPMFRYERPQKGRYRQFWQLDVEALGSGAPEVDLEIVTFAVYLFDTLGLSNLEVVVNSVGCPACRPVYREALKEYVGSNYDELCKTCQNRFERNPLRILDCKNEHCREIMKESPGMVGYLCDECSEHFQKVKEGMSLLGISYKEDKNLVRGLDYYTKTAFEVLSGELGAQNAVCGGGRYDNLAEAIGGPHVPGVGFAAGIERIVLTMEGQGCDFGRKPGIDVFVAIADDSARKAGLKLLYDIRRDKVSADMDYSGKSLSSQLKMASNKKAKLACILGSAEIQKGVVTVKDLASGLQEEVHQNSLMNHIKQYIVR